ncbi:MAG: TetR/AcrR family transcriptional regulator [Candidatus Metalachnospira sp.]|nr:TetR/AcrR family transcriptional regulator [Candidatus Metalachnospira sp.]
MKADKPNRKKEQGADTKKRLYESAEKLFQQYDYKDVNIEAITEAAGVTKGTFYVHFDSKDALYITLFSTYVERLDMNYKAFLDNLPADLSTADTILAFAGDIADLMVDKVGYDNLRTVYTLQLTSIVSTEAIKGYGRNLYKMFSDILDQGIQKGEFKTSLPLDILTKHFVMSIRGLTYEWCIRYPSFDLKEQVLTHFRLMLEGITNNAN